MSFQKNRNNLKSSITEELWQYGKDQYLKMERKSMRRAHDIMQAYAKDKKQLDYCMSYSTFRRRLKSLNLKEVMKKRIGERNTDKLFELSESQFPHGDLKFYKIKKKLPTANDESMVCYANVIARGVWRDLGINTWNDLLKKTFGRINKPNRIYKGEIGLERAKTELLQFFKTHKSKPTSEEKSVSSILVAIKKGYWNKFGITSWNGLLHYVFGSVNVNKGIWTGKKGLENAKIRLKDYFKQYKGLPSRRAKGMGGIVKAIQRGYWIEFEINYWNDLLLLVFGRTNQDHQKRK